jgi:hypothetical protein
MMRRCTLPQQQRPAYPTLPHALQAPTPPLWARAGLALVYLGAVGPVGYMFVALLMSVRDYMPGNTPVGAALLWLVSPGGEER